MCQQIWRISILNARYRIIKFELLRISEKCGAVCKVVFWLFFCLFMLLNDHSRQVLSKWIHFGHPDCLGVIPPGQFFLYSLVGGDSLLVGSRNILRLQMRSIGAFFLRKNAKIRILNAWYGLVKHELLRIFEKHGAVFWSIHANKFRKVL